MSTSLCTYLHIWLLTTGITAAFFGSDAAGTISTISDTYTPYLLSVVLRLFHAIPLSLAVTL